MLVEAAGRLRTSASRCRINGQRRSIAGEEEVVEWLKPLWSAHRRQPRRMRIPQVEFSRRAYLLLWVAVLFVIFQTPLILSRVWKSIQPLESSESKLSWTAAASPTWVTEMKRPATPQLGGAAHLSKSSEIRCLCRPPSASI